MNPYQKMDIHGPPLPLICMIHLTSWHIMYPLLACLDHRGSVGVKTHGSRTPFICTPGWFFPHQPWKLIRIVSETWLQKTGSWFAVCVCVVNGLSRCKAGPLYGTHIYIGGGWGQRILPRSMKYQSPPFTCLDPHCVKICVVLLHFREIHCQNPQQHFS